MKGLLLFDLEGTLVDSAGQNVSQVYISESQLQSLAQEYILGIVTGATRLQLQEVFAQTYLGTYVAIENTVTVTEVSEAKKTGIPFLQLRNIFPEVPSVVIGDSDGDVLGAHAIGVPCVHVDPVALQQLGFAKMEIYLTKVRELCN